MFHYKKSSHILVLREADNRINLVVSVFGSKLFDDQGLFSLLPENEYGI